jgi:hypothetical protein
VVAKLSIDHYTVNSVKIGDVTFQQRMVDSTFHNFSDLFTDKYGCCAKLQGYMQDGGQRETHLSEATVQYASEDRVDQEIKRLEGIGIVQNTEYSPWRTPLVPIVKSDGRKLTVNPQWNEDTRQGLEVVGCVC